MNKNIFELESPGEVIELIGGKSKLYGYSNVIDLIEQALSPGGASLPNNRGLRQKVQNTARYYHDLLRKAGYFNN